MALNIKNPEAVRLAREISALTGETLTAAVIESLRARLERLRLGPAPALAEEILRISRRCAALPVEDARTSEAIIDFDDHGAPA